MNSLDPQPDKALVDEALRRVGRNLVLYQQIEMLLKALLSGTRIAGYASEVPMKVAERAKSVAGKSLGQLTNEYLDEILGRNSTALPEPKEVREIYFRHTFTIDVDSATLARDEAMLLALTDERNHLAHTFLNRWKPSSEKSTNDALRYLDEQRSRAIPVRDHLKALFEAISEQQKRPDALRRPTNSADVANKRFDLIPTELTTDGRPLVRRKRRAVRPWTTLVPYSGTRNQSGAVFNDSC